MSGRITDYKVVCNDDVVALEKTIQEYFCRGWKLYGTPFSSGEYICQAVVYEVLPVGKKGGAR